MPLLLLLFAASGAAALIYEVVWLQMLELVIGATAVSMAVLLGTYMGGMCLGSIMLSRAVDMRRHPLRVYAAIELGIGICGLGVLFGLPWLNRFYAATGGGIPLRGVVCGVCLLAPTLLMGASLPAVARWVEMTPRGVARLGFLYGANIAGAVAGCLLAGFYLLRVHDTAVATFAAAAINVAIALAAYLLGSRRPYIAQATTDSAALPAAIGPAVYWTIALSGLTALGAEVIWTRLLSLMLGATVYTFSIILVVFLVGLGLGSAAGAALSRRVSAKIALGCCQLLLAAAILWTAFLLARTLPYWKVDPKLAAQAWLKFRLDFGRCLLALLPATFLWGASFPLALAAAAGRRQDPGRLMGRIYAANTAGAIAGAIGFSLLVVPAVGTQQAQRILIVLAVLSGMLVLRLRYAAPAAVAGLLAVAVPAVPWQAIAWGRQLPQKPDVGQLLYVGEGMNASIAITERYKTRMFHISGKVEASNEAQDMRVERMLGHFPALLHARPRSTLVVGCGAGVTAGSLILHPEMERVTICELEPLIPPAIARFFAKENHNVIHDPRTRVVFDDARHFVLTTPDRFDIITSDPIHPWVKGSATLYTTEYYEMCKRHLNPGGVIAQWVPLYESDTETVKSQIATFFQVFPDGIIWSNDTIFQEGYDVVLFGQAGPTRIDVAALQQRLDRPDHAAVVQSLHEVGFNRALGLLITYAGRGRDLASWLRGAQINRDRNLRLQFLAGMNPDLQGGFTIYDDILRFRDYPESLFVASAENRSALLKSLKP
jgi:spermidine synthase